VGVFQPCARIQIGELSDQLLRRIYARFRLAGPCLCAAPQPFDLIVDAILERFLPFALRVKIFLLCLKKRTVISFHTQQPIVIDTIDLYKLSCDVFKQVTIVAYYHTRKRSGLEKSLKPSDSGKIEMVGRLVEKQNI